MPPAFAIRVVSVPPGRTRPYDGDEWRDALVLVERGELELEGLTGALRRFACGDMLCLAGLSLRALHNRGRVPAVLVTFSRISS